MTPAPCHRDLDAFERGMRANDPAISPAQLYAYAAIMEGVPYANGAPNLSCDFPALEELAIERKVPIAGKDFKTGQTLMKTALARLSRRACSGSPVGSRPTSSAIAENAAYAAIAAGVAFRRGSGYPRPS